MSSADQAATTQLYKAELERKQGLRGIQYWYKGKPVASGSFADARPTGVPIQ
jgi:hypothetical protein